MDCDDDQREMNNSIVIIKKLPILQCENCIEYLIEDSIMKKVDNILNKTNEKAEIEVISYTG